MITQSTLPALTVGDCITITRVRGGYPGSYKGLLPGDRATVTAIEAHRVIVCVDGLSYVLLPDVDGFERNQP